MRLSPQKIKKFQEKILSWYSHNKRDLPWRNTTDPYAILVSEVMLQQTRVDRVIPYYQAWLQQWPTAKELTKATKETLLSSWSGLGYNSRALRLQQTASAVQDRFPQTYEELIQLPGIGPYTANALLAFAFNKNVAVIDTNIRRVFIHELGLAEDISEKALHAIALQVVPPGKARIWYNALMDYGAMEKTSTVTGIASLSKQGTFEGSTRQIRGKIIKLLLQKKKLSLSFLKKTFPRDDLHTILEKLEKEKIITKEKQSVVLA